MIMNKPPISVIIPLYNKEAIIKRTIESVLSQSYRNFELIIVNDGSTDSSGDIVKLIEDERIRYIEQKNGGPSKARNTGILNAKGEWVYLIDADDEMIPGALAHFSKLIKKHPKQKMFCGEVAYKGKVRKQYEEGKLVDGHKATFYGEIYQCSGSTLYKKDFCISHLYDEKIRRYEDLDCLFKKYRESRIYLTHFPVGKVNLEFSSASKARKDINEDFAGHIDFKNKSFWEKMALFTFYLGERDYYRPKIDKMYPFLRYRYDLLLLTKILKKIRFYENTLIKRHI